MKRVLRSAAAVSSLFLLLGARPSASMESEKGWCQFWCGITYGTCRTFTPWEDCAGNYARCLEGCEEL